MLFEARRNLVAGLILAAPLVSAQKEVPDASDLKRRALGDVAILGDYMYFEGGEISQYVMGEKDSIRSRTLNVTLSVSLKESWHNESVSFNEIDRGDKPLVKDNSIWVDTQNDRLYQWDGQGPGSSTEGATNPKLWTFSPNDDGKGEWSTTRPSNPSTYNNLLRHAGGASVVCGGRAYSIGGFGTGVSDTVFESNDPIPVPGMVTVDLDSQEWNNRSLSDFSSPHGIYVRGRATCVSGFGDESYVMTIGGRSTPADDATKGEPMSMRNITMWDAKEEKWLWQETTGDAPAGRWDHCIAGQASKNGTYEILVYGGRNNAANDLDDVWVLTLPGFRWMRVKADSPKRYMHVCHSLGKGQVLSSGGYSNGGWSSDDPWVNGLGVFDMSAFKWATGYDADAGDYEPAKAVQDWYNDGGMDDVEWSSGDVEAIFASKPFASDSSNSGGSGSSDSNSSGDGDNSDNDNSGNDNSDDNSNNNSNNDDSDDDDSTPTAAIAGGVVGGVAALAIVGAAIFFCRRRKQKGSESTAELHSESIQPGYQHGAGSEYSPSHPTASPPPPMSQGYYTPGNQYQPYEYKPGETPVQQYSAELPAHQNSLVASELEGMNTRPSELHGGPPVIPGLRRSHQGPPVLDGGCTESPVLPQSSVKRKPV